MIRSRKNSSVWFGLLFCFVLEGLVSGLAFAGEPNYLYPDLIPWVSEDRDYLQDWYISGNQIRVNTAVGNAGDGLFQIRIVPGTGSGGTIPTYQRVFIDTDNGPTYEDFFANDSVYHASHGHMHMSDFATFSLHEAIEVDGRWSVGETVASNDKASFYLVHVTRVPGMPNLPAYPTTNAGVYQNISRGWMDVYSHWITGQYIPISGVPVGPKYWLRQTVDPTDVILETDEENNVAQILIDLTHQESAFRNPDGSFIQPGDFVDGNPADFDDDGDVDGDDFLAWQASFGVDGGGDADGDGDTDGDDFLTWQAEFGGGAGAFTVPEPSASLLTLAVLAIVGLLRTSRFSKQ